ncbi:MAG: hypothetical protein JO301_16950 [Chitinophagaceae bacterium]|nr:hypothetical protein [Chitinophagaceae bacterium]
MASVNLYKKFGKTETSKNRDGGYKNILLFAPVSTFTSIKVPTLSAALGDTKKIVVAHTFPADEGFMSLLSKLHSVTTKSTTVGDEGAQRLQHEFEGVILGDSALHLEQLEAQLNDNSIWLVKDQDCLNTDNYVQFGDECLTPNIKLEFTGNTTKEGLKEYKITGTVIGKKFFYTATVTEKP